MELRNSVLKKITIFHNFYFFLGLIGLYPFANVLNLAMMTAFLLLMTWSYVKYSGNFSEIGSTIDELSMTIWDSAIQPTFSKVAEESANYAARQAVQRLNSTSNPPPAMSVKKKQWDQIIRKNSFVVDQIDYIIIGRNGNPINFNLIHIVWKSPKMSHFSNMAYFTNICPINMSGNTVWPQAIFFSKTEKLTILSTQNVNIACFARNIECDFFCAFSNTVMNFVPKINIANWRYLSQEFWEWTNFFFRAFKSKKWTVILFFNFQAVACR